MTVWFNKLTKTSWSHRKCNLSSRNYIRALEKRRVKFKGHLLKHNAIIGADNSTESISYNDCPKTVEYNLLQSIQNYILLIPTLPLRNYPKENFKNSKNNLMNMRI